MNNNENQLEVKSESAAPVMLEKRPSALGVMANRLNVDPAKLLSTLKNTVFKGSTDDELLALVVVANTYGLNPLLKELYAFPKKGGGIVPMIPIDGWIKLMNQAESFDGVEFEFSDDDKAKPFSCTAIIYIKNRSKPIRVTEYYSECYRNTDPWNQMPRRMLRHKALIQASRIGFGFAGIYDEDEASDQVQSRVDSAIPVKEVREVASEEKPTTFRSGKSYQKMVETFKGGGWRDVEVHWGTEKLPVKGHTLGDLAENNKQAFHFLRVEWEPEAFKGKFNVADLALRSALDAAHKEHEAAKSDQANKAEDGQVYNEAGLTQEDIKI